MSKKERKYDSLPKHQKKIALCLAKEGPSLIMKINDIIKGEYTSTNRAFHELEAKEQIKKVGISTYRGREFPTYWLTIRGVGWALLNGVKVDYVRENALKTSENENEKKAIEAYFMLRESDGSKLSQIFDEFILKQGVVDTPKLLRELIPAMFSLESRDIDKVIGTAKKAEYWKYAKEVLEKMNENLRKVLSHE